MAGYLIDTNILSGFISGALSGKGLVFMDDVLAVPPNISIITQIELLSWKTDNTTAKLIKALLGDSNIINISQEAVEKIAAIRKARKTKTPDAIIAATAIVNDCTLVTHNISDFEGIGGLKLIDPHNL